jgi:hypothetical protein
MKLFPIDRAYDKGTYWVNPNLIVGVVECNIGHKNQGVFGTSILVQGLNALQTNESIESVIERIENESN